MNATKSDENLTAAPLARGVLQRWFISNSLLSTPQAAAPIVFALVALPLTGDAKSGAAIVMAMTIAQVLGAVPIARLGRNFNAVTYLKFLIALRTVAFALIATLAAFEAPFVWMIVTGAVGGLVNGVLIGEIGGQQSAVILRYGEKLTLPSHKINYHANIWALRELGVESIISQNAIGSVNPAIRPGDIVISDDFLDKTKSRAQSLFDESECWVRGDLIAAANKHSNRVIERGTFVCTEGPRFETPAEIRAYAREGVDIVGTPLVPEVIFAREAEMCFASIAPVINFGAGMAPAVVHFGPGGMNEIYYKEGLHDLIEKTLIDAISGLSTERTCTCGNALEGGFHGRPPTWLKRRAHENAARNAKVKNDRRS